VILCILLEQYHLHFWGTAGNAWQVSILNNRFYKNVGDIVLKGCSNTRPQDVLIQGNLFSGYAAYTDCNILCAIDGFGSVNILDNIFGQLPALTSGTTKRYMKLTSTLSGMVVGNSFGCVTDAAGSELTFKADGTAALIPTTVHVVRNYGQAETDGVTGEINIS